MTAADRGSAPAWHGEAELLIYRDGVRLAVALELRTKPAPPGKADRWAGSFTAPGPGVLTPGRGLLRLPGGAEAEVMVEGFDALTGKGDLIGIDAAPF
ncbi:MAG TPA: hypothetical protein VFD32_08780 [Dehalococcoidia bacterium]|nr:hypothetical protein [Dehalococcoidia bacterium]